MMCTALQMDAIMINLDELNRAIAANSLAGIERKACLSYVVPRFRAAQDGKEHINAH
jgi:hypothetical protein